MSDLVDEIRERLASPIFRAFRPWVTPDGRSPQREFLRARRTHRNRVYRGGNRTGKTTILGVDTALFALGWHPHARHRPPVHIWIVGLDWERVGRVLWPAIKPWIPKDKIRGVDWIRSSEPECPRTIVLTNGSVIDFKSAEQRVDKFSGSKIHFAGLDEEMDREMVDEVRARLVDYDGDLALTLTPVARKLWVQDLEAEDDGRATYVIRASMRDAALSGILPEGGVDRFLRSLSERDRRVRELGDFAAFEGLVYPEYDPLVHKLRPVSNSLVTPRGEIVYPWPIPADWPRFASMDFGFTNPGCILLAAKDPHRDALIVTNAYHAANVKIDDWIKVAKKLPHREFPLCCDHDAGDRAMLEANGVMTIAARKEPWQEGVTAVSRRLLPTAEGRPRLYFVVSHVDDDFPSDPITGRCDAFALDQEIRGYRLRERDEERPDPKDEPVKKNDHAMDALRYLCRELDARGGSSVLEELGKLVRPKNVSWGGLGGMLPPKPFG